MNTSSILWVNKYKPKSFEEIIGNYKAISEFRSWLENKLKGKAVKHAALLWGPPGVGKTLTVEVAASTYNLELIQMNASDFRTRYRVERILGRASETYSLLGRGRIILVDEVDGINMAEDRGGLNAIIKLVDLSIHPVVLTANDPWNPNFRGLRERCKLIKYSRVNVRSIVSFLRKICLAEGIAADPSALKFIADRSGGDVRSAINDLQSVAFGKRRLTLEDVNWIAFRDRQLDAFEVLRGIFSSSNCRAAKAALSRSTLDYNMLLQWIHENLPLQYTLIEELIGGYEALSRADIYFGRIRSSQDWSLLSYALDLMSAGVAMARRRKFRFVKYNFPERIRLLSQTRTFRSVKNHVLSAIAKKCHVSKRIAGVEYLPFLKVIFELDPETASGIAKWLDLDSASIIFLTGSYDKAERILLRM